MRLRSTLVAMLLGILSIPMAWAAPPVAAQVEISFLLGYIEGSACEFNRNGTWSNSRAAQAHIRAKYKVLSSSNLIETTEQFIERAATQSSLTGEAYMVRCNGGTPMPSQQWLREELARLRAY